MAYNICNIFSKALVFTLFIGLVPSFGIPLDSLRTEQIDGKLFIIHQVDEGETLYAISRRYKISVSTVISHNPSAQLNLKIGVLLKVPLTNPVTKIDTAKTATHKVSSGETLFSIARQYKVSVANIKSWNNLITNTLHIGQILYIKFPVKPVSEELSTETTNHLMHTVQQGETLYSLSKKYNIDLHQLSIWNNLQDNTILHVDQLLIVGKKDADMPVKESTDQEAKNLPIKESIDQEVKNLPIKENIDQEVKKSPIIDTLKIATTQAIVPIDTTKTFKRITNVHGFEEIVESGIGELISVSTEKRKYLGLHHTAKVGTIVKVRNEMNDKVVFVRIIGHIPNTGDNEKILLKISKAAYDQLGIINSRFRIEISYMP